LAFERLPGLGWELGTALLAAAIGVVAALACTGFSMDCWRGWRGTSERARPTTSWVASLRRPTRYAMVALGLVLAARETPLLAEVWQKLAGFVMPALIGWIALASLHAFVRRPR
jgi:hypothetical protein